ncbi:beta,beta-carotene 15,15'-dioxygenase [Nephila pilipes]|uniref:Beta,beta-carotene 15,15'-dioxygenase n=1 Tax=Nephila pilipes TaxID=299642 RepID=A0A8X6NU16_NEPPI|nr:beta,beta-carotene 15,15'-dioxygenase [Nephila pilipes]
MVSVKSKFLDSEAYRKLSQFNRLVYTEFGTRSYPDLCKNIFQRFFAHFLPISFTDNTFANICMLEDEMYLFSETNNIWKVNPEDLSCVEKTDITNVVSVDAATSHPHQISNGTIYNLGSSVITGLKYHVMKISPSTGAEGPKTFERVTIHSTISSSYKTSLGYYHSFGLSENYILLVEQPLLINTLKMAVSGIVGYCLRDLLEWYPKQKVIFHLMDLRTGIQTKTKYVANAFFFFHHINTYEEDGHVVADILAYPDAEVLDILFLDKLREGKMPEICAAITTRFILPLKTDGKEGSNLITLKNTHAAAIKQNKNAVLLIPETKGPSGFEMPTINYSMFNAKKYRYMYSTSYFYQGDVANTVQYSII